MFALSTSFYQKPATMKSTVLAFLVIGVICVCQAQPGIQAVPAPGRGALKGYCLTSEDCFNRNKCCVSFERLRGKRDLSPDLKRFVDGKCEPLGNVGAGCIKDPLDTGTPGLYYNTCPCGPGLVCVGTGVIDNPVGEIGICSRDRSQQYWSA